MVLARSGGGVRTDGVTEVGHRRSATPHHPLVYLYTSIESYRMEALNLLCDIIVLMKKIIWAVLIVVVVAGGAFLFYTRPASAPSEPETGSTETATSTGAYSITGESTAEFRIGEILNGKPFTPVGVTSAISGSFSIVEKDGVRTPVLDEIKINARTFKTDDERRDGAIAHLILKSEDPANEFIVFKPMETVGTPDSFDLDTEYSFRILGNLTISGVTKQVWFDVTATVGASEAHGTAIAEIKRSDFSLVIPNVPFVASVNDSFQIKATIVAKK